MDSVDLPEFGIPISRKAPVLQATGGSSSSSPEEVQHPAPDAAALDSDLQQVRKENPPQDPSTVTSQFTPEETPARVLPDKHLGLGLKPAIRDRLSRFPHITVTKAVPRVPLESSDSPLLGLAKMNAIVNKLSHLWL